MIITDSILKIEGWEIFYKDGTIVSSLDIEWENAPIDDVLGVIVWHEYHVPNCRKKTLLGGTDYYVLEEEYWGTTNDFEEVKEYPYKKGVWTTDEHMEEVHRFIFEKLDIG